MSIRIDTGFVFPLDKLSEFQERAYARITGELTEVYREAVERARMNITNKGELAQILRGIEMHGKENAACGYHFFFEENSIHAYYWGGESTKYDGSDLDYVYDCSYWNNRNQPECIADQEWKLRGELWSKLLSQEGNPSAWNRKLSWQVIDGFEIHKIMMSLVRNGQTQTA